MASTTQLISEVAEDIRKLLRQEIDLAKAELAWEWKKIKEVAVMVALVTSTALVSLGLFAITIVQLLITTHLPVWACYATGLVIFAMVSFLIGLQIRRTLQKLTLTPKETLKSFKDNVRIFSRNRDSLPSELQETHQ